MVVDMTVELYSMRISLRNGREMLFGVSASIYWRSRWIELLHGALDASSICSVVGGILFLTRCIDDDSGALICFGEEAFDESFGWGARLV